MFWNYFENKRKKKEALELARKAFRDMLSSFKENDEHPCPDYNLKYTLEVCAARYARTALKTYYKLPQPIFSGLSMIIDHARLKEQKLPIPVEMLKSEIENAAEYLKVTYGKKIE